MERYGDRLTTRLLRRLLVFVVLTILGAAGAFTALASTVGNSARTPICRPAQKSSKARPCLEPCKPGQKSTSAKPCAKAVPVRITITIPTTTPLARSQPRPATTATGPYTGVPALPSDGCPPGTVSPLNPDGSDAQDQGDGDADNQSGFPSDGDGCF
jgi:hypothetical protein